ncbi:SoxR reducing system RseC family protein [Sinimarinibacterium sp. NLF-5-8]|uniref:SoxR reducing system RseC family protein n=1 Tax=Sinimarinibacterium sp. NLF-5-8 TaxID=2698684 RepID=UPI00137BA905|nr:SoxR reducing system RseC family protein [Sinimarinibacterium sp. NLF-5-8]QHS09833.1 SoxR reducing system RseC family protein [Sinimarinibacterium sp. NLF-5-8]
MIEQRAIVTHVDAAGVWIQPIEMAGCVQCRRGQGCGEGALMRALGGRRRALPIIGDGGGLHAGDAILVGIDEQALLGASLRLYLAPLIGMLVAGTFAHSVLHAHELLVAAFALSGLVGGFALIRRAAERAAAAPALRPRLLRRLRPDEQGCLREQIGRF